MAGTNKILFPVLFFLFYTGSLLAQDRTFVIYFKDKNGNPYSLTEPSLYLSAKSLERREKQNIPISENDLPVNPDYLDSLTAKGAQVLYSLKWLNAAVVTASQSELDDISTLSFVQNSSRTARQMQTRALSSSLQTAKGSVKKNMTSYGNSYNQVQMLQVNHMHQEGFHGENMLIAILDAGFKNAPSQHYLAHVYANNRVVATYDFVDMETNVYDNHHHGLEVLSVIAGYQEDALIGTAYNASFVLLRTENEYSETETEETNWARAAEYADSIGVDLLCSSLGYTTFDLPATSHTYQDLDGNTTISARAADLAASKGILVICSAGNEGGNSWGYVSTPADGDSVLAIGAVDTHLNYAHYSSIGPSADGRIKPDLAALGTDVTLGSVSGIVTNSGTSFSCPLVAGLAAGLWQAFPSLTNMQIADALRKSASQNNRPDQYLGYGIPGYMKAKEYINDSIFNIGINIKIFPNPLREGYVCFTAGAEYFGQEITIKMYDLLGKAVAEDQVTITGLRNETHVNALQLRDGIYVIRFYFPDRTVKTRLLKY